jgi:hypothetical protein
MDMHKRFITTLALAGVLTAAGASVARAQDTTAAARSDTMGYRPSEGQTDTTQADTGKFQYNGAPSDTALRAKPGVQTGPSAGDSGKAAARAGEAGLPDTVACKDGSNAGRTVGCSSHGGIDWAATKAAMKARGGEAGQTGDTTAMPADTTQASQQGADDYQSHGAPSDTALKAKPGTQTGPSDTGAAKADTGTSR